MKLWFIIFILFGFIGISVFGFAAMNLDAGHAHEGCIAAVVRGVLCPIGAEFDFLLFHLDTFMGFSMAVFADNPLTAFTFFVMTLAAASYILIFRIYASGQEHSFLLYRISKPPIKIEFSRWLSLHENSPAAV
jgi:hypothetical protein